MAAPGFMGVHVAVADMPRSIAFYRCVGLHIPDGIDLDPHVELDLGGGAHLSLSTPAVIAMYDPAWRGHDPSTSTVLQFGLDSREAVDALYADLLASGYRGHLAPIDAFWGSRYCEIEDPDGHTVGFHSPRDPDRADPDASAAS